MSKLNIGKKIDFDPREKKGYPSKVNSRVHQEEDDKYIVYAKIGKGHKDWVLLEVIKK
jgi:hypothetical protein